MQKLHRKKKQGFAKTLVIIFGILFPRANLISIVCSYIIWLPSLKAPSLFLLLTSGVTFLYYLTNTSSIFWISVMNLFLVAYSFSLLLLFSANFILFSTCMAITSFKSTFKSIKKTSVFFSFLLVSIWMYAKLPLLIYLYLKPHANKSTSIGKKKPWEISVLISEHLHTFLPLWNMCVSFHTYIWI